MHTARPEKLYFFDNFFFLPLQLSSCQNCFDVLLVLARLQLFSSSSSSFPPPLRSCLHHHARNEAKKSPTEEDRREKKYIASAGASNIEGCSKRCKVSPSRTSLQTALKITKTRQLQRWPKRNEYRLWIHSYLKIVCGVSKSHWPH